MYTEKLMLARERMGMSQAELSRRLGIKQQQYARYEKGINIMPITYLKQICSILDISADYIIGLTNEMTTYTSVKKKDIKNAIRRDTKILPKDELIKKLEREMNEASKTLEFEKAKEIRDILFNLKN